MANRTVDYEEVQWLNFTVRASDNGSPRRSAEIPVYLQIVDINDNNPIFSQPSYQVSEDTFSESWGFSEDTTTTSVPEPSKEDAACERLVMGRVTRLRMSIYHWWY